MPVGLPHHHEFRTRYMTDIQSPSAKPASVYNRKKEIRSCPKRISSRDASVQNEPNFNLGKIHATLYFVGDCSGETLPASSKRIKNKPNQSLNSIHGLNDPQEDRRGSIQPGPHIHEPPPQSCKTNPINPYPNSIRCHPRLAEQVKVSSLRLWATTNTQPPLYAKRSQCQNGQYSSRDRPPAHLRVAPSTRAYIHPQCAKQTQSCRGTICACRFATRLYAAELSPPPQKNKPNQSQSAASTRGRPALFHNSREIPRPPAYNLPQCCSPGRAEVGNLHDRPQRCLRQGAGK